MYFFIDDWITNVENAIAMALKKDGIEPKTPKISSKTVQEVKTDSEDNAAAKTTKRRKRKSKEKEQQRKKQKLDGGESDKQYAQDESDDLDEYEMLNVRGGSPPLHGNPVSSTNSAQIQKQNMYYDSDGSYSSYDSYDSADHRSRRHRSKRRAHERNSRSGNHKSSSGKRDKRRRDDSDNEGGNNERGIIIREPGTGGGGRNNNNNGPRKQELCKFYLMECCAKGDKCLYMHGDFPCKFYYLGMKNHNRETCKFSHGKPLTDQLRNILLKHLETAPKEIIGDFPRMSRENALNMISAQHQKLLVKFGMEPEANKNVPSSNIQQNKAIKIPSLMDLITKFPSPTNELSSNAGMVGSMNAKKEKPRRTRWCDPKTNEPIQITGVQSATIQNQIDDSDSGNISLKTLTNVITPEQVDKLAKLGIETVKQVTQLTVLQVIELGLNITQITELQTIALNTQKLINNATNVSIQSNTAPMVETATATFSTSYNEQPKDQDMRLQLANPPEEATKPSESNALSKESINQDVDMRILALSLLPVSMSNQSSVDKKVKETTTVVATKSEMRSNKQLGDHSSKIDYSQYLKDANLDLNQSDLDEPMSKCNLIINKS